MNLVGFQMGAMEITARKEAGRKMVSGKFGHRAYEKERRSQGENHNPGGHTASRRGLPRSSDSALTPNKHSRDARTSPNPVRGRRYRKAATLLRSLERDKMLQILRRLTPSEVRGIVGEMVLMEEERGEAPLPGGVEGARELLHRIYGAKQGEELFHRYIPFEGGVPFAFLGDLEHHQIFSLIGDEEDQVVALILANVSPSKASRLLQGLPEIRQRNITRMIARGERVEAGKVMEAEERLREKIRVQGNLVTREVDGVKTLASILKYLDSQQEGVVLETLHSEHPGLADMVKNSVFSIEDTLRIPDRELEAVLRGVEDRTLGIIIKGKQPRVREKILSNLSDRRRVLVEEESVLLGGMLKREVDEITDEFIRSLRDLEERGELEIPRSGDMYL